MDYAKINIVISAIVALILFGAFNGLIIKWHNAHGAMKQLLTDEQEARRTRDIGLWSTWWHRCGLAIRVFIWLIVWFITRDYVVLLTVMLNTAIEYNVSINLINGLKWYYVGTTAKTDILIRKIFKRIKFDK